MAPNDRNGGKQSISQQVSISSSGMPLERRTRQRLARPLPSTLNYADEPADPRVSEASRIVRREDISANLFQFRPPAVAYTARSEPNPASPSTGPAADSRASPGSAAGCGYRRGLDRHDDNGCRTFACLGGSWRAS